MVAILSNHDNDAMISEISTNISIESVTTSPTSQSTSTASKYNTDLTREKEQFSSPDDYSEDEERPRLLSVSRVGREATAELPSLNLKNTDLHTPEAK